ncbi:MAG: polyprenyl synthetase family protein [Oscillospiraceae bacterium]
MSTFDERFDEYKNMIEPALADYFGKRRGYSFDGLLSAMDYSLMAGGKRLRPILVLAFCRACGGEVREALPVACAAEMLHTYSLIHDDLPCMDNDELRRGKPTNHMVYGECTATLAGDALQAEAFGTILRSGLSAGRRLQCAELLASAAGVDGICGGQFVDVASDGKTLSSDELLDLQARKTGSLLSCVCMMGAACAGAPEEKLQLAGMYGATLGAAFQIRDDMLDVLSTDEELGKPIGSDKTEGKTTFMSLYGEEKCADMIARLTEAAKTTATQLGGDSFLSELADSLAERRK